MPSINSSFKPLKRVKIKRYLVIITHYKPQLDE